MGFYVNIKDNKYIEPLGKHGPIDAIKVTQRLLDCLKSDGYSINIVPDFDVTSPRIISEPTYDIVPSRAPANTAPANTNPFRSRTDWLAMEDVNSFILEKASSMSSNQMARDENVTLITKEKMHVSPSEAKTTLAIGGKQSDDELIAERQAKAIEAARAAADPLYDTFKQMEDESENKPTEYVKEDKKPGMTISDIEMNKILEKRMGKKSAVQTTDQNTIIDRTPEKPALKEDILVDNTPNGTSLTESAVNDQEVKIDRNRGPIISDGNTPKEKSVLENVIAKQEIKIEPVVNTPVEETAPIETSNQEEHHNITLAECIALARLELEEDDEPVTDEPNDADVNADIRDELKSFNEDVEPEASNIIMPLTAPVDEDPMFQDTEPEDVPDEDVNNIDVSKMSFADMKKFLKDHRMPVSIHDNTTSLTETIQNAINNGLLNDPRYSTGITVENIDVVSYQEMKDFVEINGINCGLRPIRETLKKKILQILNGESYEKPTKNYQQLEMQWLDTVHPANEQFIKPAETKVVQPVQPATVKKPSESQPAPAQIPKPTVVSEAVPIKPDSMFSYKLKL